MGASAGGHLACLVAVTAEDEKTEAINTLKENLEKINLHGKRVSKIVSVLQEHATAGTTHEFFEEKRRKW